MKSYVDYIPHHQGANVTFQSLICNHSKHLYSLFLFCIMNEMLEVIHSLDVFLALHYDKCEICTVSNDTLKCEQYY